MNPFSGQELCLVTIRRLSNPSGRSSGKRIAPSLRPRLPEGKNSTCSICSPIRSGDGLHVGHPEGYTATDIVAGSIACGVAGDASHGLGRLWLPAEQHAKKTGTHPRMTTETNIANFRRQLKMLGSATTGTAKWPRPTPDYFRWTQCIFLVLFDTWFDRGATEEAGRLPNCRFRRRVARRARMRCGRYQDEHRLAYQLEAPVNWCPALGHRAGQRRGHRRGERAGRASRGPHAACGNGCCGSRPMPIAWKRTSTRWIGPRASSCLQRNWIGRSTGPRSISLSAAGLGRRWLPRRVREL